MMAQEKWAILQVAQVGRFAYFVYLQKMVLACLRRECATKRDATAERSKAIMRKWTLDNMMQITMKTRYTNES